ncbi:flagellar protein FlaG [Pseudocolwellia agarivorans]|uniref:flagellar protein FlaG n=1 Tax=Pseudocolwellia agarivorans TaxID=1911682 RepID=UPI000986070C|nr:flagellar protein FlaG [Pseudocolwellia agarivorans]
MSINIANSNPINMADDLNQLNKNTKSPPDLAIEKEKAFEDPAAQETIIKLNKVAELQRVKESEEQSLEDKSSESLADEANMVSDAMKTISEFINMPIRTVNFTQDDGSEKTVIKIFDSENNELIKQFPSEEILSIAQKIVELREDVSKKTGILLDESI